MLLAHPVLPALGRPKLGSQRTQKVVCALPANSSPQNSNGCKHNSSDESELKFERVATVAGATIIINTLVAGVKAVNAGERNWKPRRHYRRLDERFSDKWADELVQARGLS